MEQMKSDEKNQDPRAFFVTQSSRTGGGTDQTFSNSSAKNISRAGYNLVDESSRHPADERLNIFQTALINNEMILKEYASDHKSSLHKAKNSHGSMVTFNLSQIS